MQETLVQFLGQGDTLEKGQVIHSSILGLPLWLNWYKICLQCRRPGFDPWVGKTPWRRERLPSPVFWPGEFHGLYSPWGRKESDTAGRLSLALVVVSVLVCSWNAFGSVPSSLVFWKSLGRINVFLCMFGRICLRKHLTLEFCL